MVMPTLRRKSVLRCAGDLNPQNVGRLLIGIAVFRRTISGSCRRRRSPLVSAVLFAAVHGGAQGIAADGDATAEIQARIDAAFLAGGDSAAYDNMFANDTVDLWLWGQTP
jgi:hypothetical protein